MIGKNKVSKALDGASSLKLLGPRSNGVPTISNNRSKAGAK